uniref:Uncharacterized protein n=1 Tax=Arundo donax TaxID=35708 RepID=A0A0A8Y361_ARUDO
MLLRGRDQGGHSRQTR